MLQLDNVDSELAKVNDVLKTDFEDLIQKVNRTQYFTTQFCNTSSSMIFVLLVLWLFSSQFALLQINDDVLPTFEAYLMEIKD